MGKNGIQTIPRLFPSLEGFQWEPKEDGKPGGPESLGSGFL